MRKVDKRLEIAYLIPSSFSEFSFGEHATECAEERKAS